MQILGRITSVMMQYHRLLEASLQTTGFPVATLLAFLLRVDLSIPAHNVSHLL